MSYNVGSCAAMTEIPLVRAFNVGKRREASPAHRNNSLGATRQPQRECLKDAPTFDAVPFRVYRSRDEFGFCGNGRCIKEAFDTVACLYCRLTVPLHQ
jgi:hypothetical protein